MNNYRISFCLAILFVFFLLSTNATAQQVINIVEKFCLQKDIEELDDYIDQKIQEDTFMTKFSSLRKVHVFEMERLDRKKIFTVREWLNGSFLNYLKPCYVKIQDRKTGKKKWCLYSHTYLVDSRGVAVAVYPTGHGIFYLVGSTFPKELLSEQNTFMFWGGWDFQFNKVARVHYIIIRAGKLFCFHDWDANKGLIPWQKYVKMMKQSNENYTFSEMLFE